VTVNASMPLNHQPSTLNSTNMSTEKTDALVIRVADFSETSRVVTFFTREWGKIATVAKGGRRLKGPFEAALDLLAACRIVFIRKSSTSLDILTEAQLISRFRPHGRNLNSLYAGYYVAELLSGLTEEYDPHPALFDEALRTLSRLSLEDDSHLPILRFELIMLREIGQLPALDVCAACGNPLAGDGVFAYWVSQGGLLCPECRQEEYQSNRIHAGTVAVLRRLAAESETAVQNLVLSPSQRRELRTIVTAAISHALGRRPKMLRYLQG
jgi:DNA repair protein RecO (recombination protein O)